MDEDLDYTVESAPPDFDFLYRWSLEMRRTNLAFTNDALRQLAAVAAALLAGAVAFFKDAMPPAFCALATAAFLVALGAALLGVMPYDVRHPPDRVDLFRVGVEAAFRFKSRLLWAAGIALLFGAVLALIGGAVRWLGG